MTNQKTFRLLADSIGKKIGELRVLHNDLLNELYPNRAQVLQYMENFLKGPDVPMSPEEYLEWAIFQQEEDE